MIKKEDLYNRINNAFSLPPLETITNETYKEQLLQTYDLHFERTRKYLLSKLNWSFAKKEAVLKAGEQNSLIFGQSDSYQFPKPSDHIRTLAVYDNSLNVDITITDIPQSAEDNEVTTSVVDADVSAFCLPTNLQGYVGLNSITNPLLAQFIYTDKDYTETIISQEEPSHQVRFEAEEITLLPNNLIDLKYFEDVYEKRTGYFRISNFLNGGKLYQEKDSIAAIYTQDPTSWDTPSETYLKKQLVVIAQTETDTITVNLNSKSITLTATTPQTEISGYKYFTGTGDVPDITEVTYLGVLDADGNSLVTDVESDYRELFGEISPNVNFTGVTSEESKLDFTMIFKRDTYNPNSTLFTEDALVASDALTGDIGFGGEGNNVLQKHEVITEVPGKNLFDNYLTYEYHNYFREVILDGIFPHDSVAYQGANNYYLLSESSFDDLLVTPDFKAFQVINPNILGVEEFFESEQDFEFGYGPNSFFIRAEALDSDNPDTLTDVFYVTTTAAFEEDDPLPIKLYKSTNQGESWSFVNSTTPSEEDPIAYSYFGKNGSVTIETENAIVVTPPFESGTSGDIVLARYDKNFAKLANVTLTGIHITENTKLVTRYNETANRIDLYTFSFFGKIGTSTVRKTSSTDDGATWAPVQSVTPQIPEEISQHDSEVNGGTRIIANNISEEAGMLIPNSNSLLLHIDITDEGVVSFSDITDRLPADFLHRHEIKSAVGKEGQRAYQLGGKLGWFNTDKDLDRDLGIFSLVAQKETNRGIIDVQTHHDYFETAPTFSLGASDASLEYVFCAGRERYYRVIFNQEVHVGEGQYNSAEVAYYNLSVGGFNAETDTTINLGTIESETDGFRTYEEARISGAYVVPAENLGEEETVVAILDVADQGAIVEQRLFTASSSDLNDWTRRGSWTFSEDEPDFDVFEDANNAPIIKVGDDGFILAPSTIASHEKPYIIVLNSDYSFKQRIDITTLRIEDDTTWFVYQYDNEEKKLHVGIVYRTITNAGIMQRAEIDVSDFDNIVIGNKMSIPEGNIPTELINGNFLGLFNGKLIVAQTTFSDKTHPPAFAGYLDEANASKPYVITSTDKFQSYRFHDLTPYLPSFYLQDGKYAKARINYASLAHQGIDLKLFVNTPDEDDNYGIIANTDTTVTYTPLLGTGVVLQTDNPLTKTQLDFWEQKQETQNAVVGPGVNSFYYPIVANNTEITAESINSYNVLKQTIDEVDYDIPYLIFLKIKDNTVTAELYANFEQSVEVDFTILEETVRLTTPDNFGKVSNFGKYLILPQINGEQINYAGEATITFPEHTEEDLIATLDLLNGGFFFDLEGTGLSFGTEKDLIQVDEKLFENQNLTIKQLSMRNIATIPRKPFEPAILIEVILNNRIADFDLVHGGKEFRMEYDKELTTSNKPVGYQGSLGHVYKKLVSQDEFPETCVDKEYIINVINPLVVSEEPNEDGKLVVGMDNGEVSLSWQKKTTVNHDGGVRQFDTIEFKNKLYLLRGPDAYDQNLKKYIYPVFSEGLGFEWTTIDRIKDGLRWNSKTASVLIHNDKLYFIKLSYPRTFYETSDLATWKEIPMPYDIRVLVSTGSYNIGLVSLGENIVMLFNKGDIALFNPDNQQYTRSKSFGNPAYHIYAPAFKRTLVVENTIYALVKKQSSDQHYYLWKSTNGTDWTNEVTNLPSSKNNRSGQLVHFNSKFYYLSPYDSDIVGVRGTVYSSDDGVTWTLVTDTAPFGKTARTDEENFKTDTTSAAAVFDNKLVNLVNTRRSKSVKVNGVTLKPTNFIEAWISPPEEVDE